MHAYMEELWTILSFDCYHWEFEAIFHIFSGFTECISLYIPLQIPMRLSGRFRLFVKNVLCVVLREK